MACISPDGKPTESGAKMLRALKSGLADQKDDEYKLSAKGVELLATLSS